MRPFPAVACVASVLLSLPAMPLPAQSLTHRTPVDVTYHWRPLTTQPKIKLPYLHVVGGWTNDGLMIVTETTLLSDEPYTVRLDGAPLTLSTSVPGRAFDRAHPTCLAENGVIAGTVTRRDGFDGWTWQVARWDRTGKLFLGPDLPAGDEHYPLKVTACSARGDVMFERELPPDPHDTEENILQEYVWRADGVVEMTRAHPSRVDLAVGITADGRPLYDLTSPQEGIGALQRDGTLTPVSSSRIVHSTSSARTWVTQMGPEGQTMLLHRFSTPTALPPKLPGDDDLPEFARIPNNCGDVLRSFVADLAGNDTEVILGGTAHLLKALIPHAPEDTWDIRSLGFNDRRDVLAVVTKADGTTEWGTFVAHGADATPQHCDTAS